MPDLPAGLTLSEQILRTPPARGTSCELVIAPVIGAGPRLADARVIRRCATSSGGAL